MKNYIWLNGEMLNGDDAQIPHKDAGFLRGLGVFDTMLGDQGQTVKAAAHFQRLINNCKTVLLYDLDINIDKLDQMAEELMEANGLSKKKARIRTQVTSGLTKEMLGKPENPLIMMSAVEAIIPDTPAPVHAHVVSDFPRIADCVYDNCKRIDYSRSYIAKHKAIAMGGNEAILTNTNGHIACATTSNLFICEDGHFVTPPLSDGVLDGITRRGFMIEKQATEESISVKRLMAADAVYLTNSILGVRRVSSINDQEFHQITKTAA